MQHSYFTLGQVARLLGRKPYLVTYAITSGHVPEPPLRIGNKRVFNREDVERLARHFRIAMPRIESDGLDGEDHQDPAHRPQDLTLAGPFTVEQAGASGHEVRDGNGAVFCWAADRPHALIVAGLLEHACRASGTCGGRRAKVGAC
jgi:hypothetical protein